MRSLERCIGRTVLKGGNDFFSCYRKHLARWVSTQTFKIGSVEEERHLASTPSTTSSMSSTTRVTLDPDRLIDFHIRLWYFCDYVRLLWYARVIQGVQRLLLQLWLGIFSINNDGIEYPFNHLIYTWGDFIWHMKHHGTYNGSQDTDRNSFWQDLCKFEFCLQ